MLRKTAGALLALAMLLGVTLAAAPAFAQDKAKSPVRCRIGAYITSISQVDTASGTFKADFWLWSICPTKDIEPLKTMEFVNAVETTASLDSLLPRGNEWWATRKISGVFRENFGLEDYPFDAESLGIQMEEGELDARDLTYVADPRESGLDPTVKLPGWKLRDFRLAAGVNRHPTTFGDPSLPDGVSAYAGLNLRIGVERAHVANFIKTTFPIYIAVVLALVSLLITDGRLGTCGGAMFAVVLSFVSVEGSVGAHDGIYLLDQLHVCALLAIISITAWGVYSLLARGAGADPKLWLRRDHRAAAILLGAFVLANAGLIGFALIRAPSA